MSDCAQYARIGTQHAQVYYIVRRHQVLLVKSANNNKNLTYKVKSLFFLLRSRIFITFLYQIRLNIDRRDRKLENYEAKHTKQMLAVTVPYTVF